MDPFPGRVHALLNKDVLEIARGNAATRNKDLFEHAIPRVEILILSIRFNISALVL